MSGKRVWVVLVAVVMVGGALVSAQEDAMSSPPATQPAARHRSRLVEPYGQMTSLTDSQKWKIEQIHADASEKMALIKEKEREAILDLLSDQQKMELQKIEDAKVVALKERAADRKKKVDQAAIAAAEAAATQPAGK